MKKRCPKCGDQPHTQDELHGKGIRVFIEIPRPNHQLELRCTRCSAVELVHENVLAKGVTK